MAAKTLKKSVSLTDSEVQTFLEGEVNKWEFWRNIVSDVYIFTKGKKSINTAKNENVELTHTQVFCGRLCVLII